MPKPNILIQLDSDAHPSVFDSVVAVDAGVDHLLRHGGVRPEDVRDLVHGAMFTRGPDDLRHTAIFIGGSNVAASERLLANATECFFGPMRVSVMFDANGANTTASAAVFAAAKRITLQSCQTLVLAATGPVGQRVVRLLAGEGAKVRAASRSVARAEQVCASVRARHPDAEITACEVTGDDQLSEALEGVELVVAAGAAGVQLLPREIRDASPTLRVAIDLNAVDPVGIEGINVTDKAAEQGKVICYGAIGVGGTKMKIHKAALRRLFETNDAVLDAEDIFQIGRELTS